MPRDRVEKNNPSSELPCPVCLLPLSIAPSFRAHGPCGNQHQMERKINNTGRYRPGKIVEINIVVSALCGHLFHKLCLRHYCVGFKENAQDFDGKIECPLCLQPISLTKVHPVDYKSCLSSSSAAIDKHYRHTQLMNEELIDQWNSTVIKEHQILSHLEESQTKLQSSKDKLAKLCERVAKAESKINRQDAIMSNIKQCDKVMDVMHKENVLLIKMYLTEIRGMSEEFLKEKRIPNPLIPYLNIIMQDERLLSKFGEILRPVEIDGLKSDTDILIKEILTKVRSDEITRKHDNPTANLLQQHLITKRKDIKVKGTRSSLVKVRRSSLVLEKQDQLPRNGSAEESMQQIMKNVKEPIKTQRNAHEKIKPKIVEGSYRSSSEIQVLLEPKKKRQDVTDSKLERLLVKGVSGDSEFIERNPFYLRRCKSTQPVLINHSARQKGEEAKAKVFRKAEEDIKQDDVLKVAGNQEPVKQLTQLEVNEEKVELLSFRDYSLESTDLRRSYREEKGSRDLNNKKESGNQMTRRTDDDDKYPTSMQCIPSCRREELGAVESVIDILFERKSKIDESRRRRPKDGEVFMQNGNKIQCDVDSPPNAKDLWTHPGNLLEPSSTGYVWGNPMQQLYNTTPTTIATVEDRSDFGFYRGASSCLTRTAHHPVFIRPIDVVQMSSYPPRTFIPLVQRIQPSYIRKWLSKLPSQSPPRLLPPALFPVFIPQPFIFPHVYYSNNYIGKGIDRYEWSAESCCFKSNESRSETNRDIDHKRNAPFGDIMSSSQINVTEDQSAEGPLTLDATSYVTINIPESNERLFVEESSASSSCGLKSHRSSEI